MGFNSGFKGLIGSQLQARAPQKCDVIMQTHVVLAT